MAMNRPAYGLYPHDAAPRDIIRTLNQAGFGKEDICLMLSPAHPIAAAVRDARTLNAEGEAVAAAEGLIGWLSKVGAVVIPTVGSFIRSQAFLHALMGARDGSVLCGRSQTLVALGFPECEAERFENQLRQVGVLIYVSCPVSAKTNWAAELLRSMGAIEAATLERGLGAAA